MSGSSLTRAGDRRPDMVAFLAILVAACSAVQAAPPADIVSPGRAGPFELDTVGGAARSFVAVAWGIERGQVGRLPGRQQQQWSELW